MNSLSKVIIDWAEELDAASLGEMAHTIYRHSQCGAWMAFTIGQTGQPDIEFPGEQAGKWTIEDLQTGKYSVVKLRIGSIIEGVDFDCEVRTIVPKVHLTKQHIWDALNEVENEADQIWNQTHGCEECPASLVYDGYNRIDPDCPNCGGEGTIL